MESQKSEFDRSFAGFASGSGFWELPRGGSKESRNSDFVEGFSDDWRWLLLLFPAFSGESGRNSPLPSQF